MTPKATDESPTSPAELKPLWQRLWPDSLFGRLLVIWGIGVGLMLSITLTSLVGERTQTGRAALMQHVAHDLADVLDQLAATPAEERPRRLAGRSHRAYQIELGARAREEAVPRGMSDAGEPGRPTRVPPFLLPLLKAAPNYRWQLIRSPHPEAGRPHTLQLATQLADGTPVRVRLHPPVPPATPARLLWSLGGLLLGIGLLSWLAVRLTTQPLARLATAADGLAKDLNCPPIPETGPREARQAAQALNGLQRSLQEALAERTRLLAAITHDLQTPITRLKLRLELLDTLPPDLRAKWQADLDAMQTLVEEGLAFAASGQSTSEPTQLVDVNALAQGLVDDYRASGRPTGLEGALRAPVKTAPQALRRILANLLDNAHAYGIPSPSLPGTHGSPVVLGLAETDTEWVLAVSDSGPGLPDDLLERVFDPFFRAEPSRNRETGGTGLGLSIARRLTQPLGGTLSLSNRTPHGLTATVRLPKQR